MESEKLMPCPFCGGEAGIQRIDDFGLFYIVCENCGAQVCSDMPDYFEEFSMKDLYGKWNRRMSYGAK
jgi:Lar family restriction alleviation protein